MKSQAFEDIEPTFDKYIIETSNQHNGREWKIKR